MTEKTHEIGPATTETVHEAYVVLKDYDGCAPDGPPTFCATEELAKEVRDFLRKHDPGSLGRKAAREKEEEEGIYDERLENLGWPFVDGAETGASWVVRKTVARRSEICCSFSEAVFG